MTNREILDKIKSIFKNNEQVAETPVEPIVEEVKNVLTPEEKLVKLEYIEKAIELASDDLIVSVYDTIFAEVGELPVEEVPAEEEAPAEEMPMEDASKEQIVNEAHIEAEKIQSEEEQAINEIKNQLTQFNTIIEGLKNENQELKNKIEDFGNKPSGNIVKPNITNKVMSDFDKQVEELKNKRNKK